MVSARPPVRPLRRAAEIAPNEFSAVYRDFTYNNFHQKKIASTKLCSLLVISLCRNDVNKMSLSDRYYYLATATELMSNTALHSLTSFIAAAAAAIFTLATSDHNNRYQELGAALGLLILEPRDEQQSTIWGLL